MKEPRVHQVNLWKIFSKIVSQFVATSHSEPVYAAQHMGVTVLSRRRPM